MNDTTVKHTSRGHHPFSPSQLQSLRKSPCYLSRSGTNEAAELGTKQHEAVESGKLSDDLTDEHAAAVDRALRMVQSVKDVLAKAGHKVYELTERYLRVDDNPIGGWIGTTGGYPDKVLLYEQAPGEWYAYILDWKFGRYAVTPAIDNMQGHAYLLGVAHLLSTLIPGFTKGRLVAGQVTFFSPHRDEEPTTHEFTQGDFITLYDEICGVVIRAQIARENIAAKGYGLDNIDNFTPHLNTCAFCARIGQCPAVAALATSIGKKYDPVKCPDDVFGVNTADMSAAARGLQLASLVKTWAEAYRARITEQAFEHPETHTPAGYRLTASYPVKVTDAKGLYEYLIQRFGAEKVHEHVDVPLTPFDKAVNVAAPRGQKEAAVEQFRQDLQNAGLTEPNSKPTISLRMK